MSGSVVIALSLAYLGLLFAIAWFADRRADAGRSVIDTPWVYVLSLAVYCTSWTFYGSVGRAVASGVGFLPIYLGPTLFFALGSVVLLKVIRVAKANRITSIADFIASRYGKSQLLGGLVTVIAVIGILPYIALQLKAVSGSFRLLAAAPTPAGAEHGWSPDSALVVAVVLSVFTVLFGTRHLDATERHEGMVAAIAFESLVKLLAFLAVGLFVVFGLFSGVDDIFRQARELPALASASFVGGNVNSGDWAALVALSFFAILLLPRQFQIAVVENVNPRHLQRAIWGFPLYLFLINLFVMPVAVAGLMLFGSGADPDSFVLTLPLAAEQQVLALVVYLGGLSAATGMVIVETIALSTMVCNDLVMPLLLKSGALNLHARVDVSRLLLTIRRGAILVIVGLGYLYFRVAGEAYALVSIGLISFAAVAQFAPVLFGGLYWKGGTRGGALAGLLAGFLVWVYTLLLPSFAKSGWLPPDFIGHGLWGLDLLKPQQLFGVTGMNEITHCLVWSLLFNLMTYVGVSLRRAPDAREARQATLFVDETGSDVPVWRIGAELDQLLPLATRFLGRERAHDAFYRHARSRGLPDVESLRSLHSDPSLTQFAETLLAGAIGAASARVMIVSLVEEQALGIDEVLNILDEASQVRAYSRELEEKSAELTRATEELSAANVRLKELDRLKDDFMSTVTHELRTPLTSIRALSEMLADDPDMDLDHRVRFFGIIISEAERLSRLINEILDLSKLESGRTVWNTAELDLNDVIRDGVAAVDALARGRGIRIEAELPAQALTVVADRDRLMQVLINLLSNAIKFAPAGSGIVQVGAGGTANEIVVHVTDNGPGIALQDQALIFDRFRQAGDILTEKPKGTGLGLPIARQIVEHFGGRLWVDSTPGAGARFSFALPLRKRPDGAHNQPKEGGGQ